MGKKEIKIEDGVVVVNEKPPAVELDKPVVRKPAPGKSKALAIWESVKNLDLELFAIADQTLEKHADPVLDYSSEELYLLLRTPAAVNELNDKISKVLVNGKRLSIEQRDRFYVISFI